MESESLLVEVKDEKDRNLLNAALIALGGIHYGYNVAVVGSVFLRIQEETGASSVLISMLSSATLVGAVLGSPASGLLANRFGRVVATIIGESLSIIGATCSYLSSPTNDGESFQLLVFARFFVGLGVGICTLAKPVYVRETTKSETTRSLIFASFPVFVAFGMMCAQAATFFDLSWRCLLALGGLPALILLIIAIGPMTESEVWLESHAKNSIDTTSQSATGASTRIQQRSTRGMIILALFSGFILAAGNQATGQYPITVYAPELLSTLPQPISIHLPQYTFILNIVNMISALLAVLLVRASNVYSMLLYNNVLGALGLILTSSLSLSPRLRFFGLVLKLLTHQIGPGSGYFVLLPELLDAAQFPAAATLVYSLSNALRYFFEFAQSFGFLTALSCFGLPDILFFYILISFLCATHAAVLSSTTQPSR